MDHTPGNYGAGCSRSRIKNQTGIAYGAPGLGAGEKTNRAEAK